MFYVAFFFFFLNSVSLLDPLSHALAVTLEKLKFIPIGYN